MKDDIHNMVLVDSSADRAALVSLGDVEKALQNVKGTKVQSLHWLQNFQEKCSSTEVLSRSPGVDPENSERGDQEDT